jgi:HPt (histidine-containing phosphotransfer) domain-containing protein
VLDEIRELQQPGPPDEVADLIRLFQESGERLLGDLDTALRSGELDAARRAAHALKGISATLGAEVLADVCATLEDAATRGDLSGIERLHHALLTEHEHALNAMLAEADKSAA